jgi:hypothetical protein
MSAATIKRSALIMYFKTTGSICTTISGIKNPQETLAAEIINASFIKAFFAMRCLTAELTVEKVPVKREVAIGTRVSLYSLFKEGSKNMSEGRKIIPPPTPRRPDNIPPQNPAMLIKIYSVNYSPYASKFE